MGAAAGAAALGCSDVAGSLPDPRKSGLEHVIVVMMENRSFDHMLGWVPGADGRQAGLKFPDKTGALQETHRLGTDFQGCGLEDPGHGYDAGRVYYNDGRMDGFLRNSEP